MTDTRKSITGVSDSATLKVRQPIPESDRPVCYNGAGLLTPSTPYCMSGVTVGVVTNDGEFRSSPAQIITGSYLAQTLTFTAYAFGPHRMIFDFPSTAAGAHAWTMPTSANLIFALKRRYGEDQIQPGLSWKTTFINSSTHILSLSFTNLSATLGFIGGAVTNTIDPATDVYARSYMFVVTNANTGSEAVTVIQI